MSPRKQAECGTRPGYQRHLRLGETPCQPCRNANADSDRRLRNTGTTKAPSTPAPRTTPMEAPAPVRRLTLPKPDGEWVHRAACADVKPDVMFPARKDRGALATARAVCARCYVQEACFADTALVEAGQSAPNRHGVRAGLTPTQRARLDPTASRRKKPTGGRSKAPCGTAAAYDRHRRNGEPIDDACRRAKNGARNQQRAAASEAA